MPSVKRPIRVTGEQPAGYANLVAEEKTKAHADHSGGDGQSVIQARKAFPRIRKREGDRGGDQHHSQGGSRPKDQRVDDRPS
jgi:hypothetical protein